LGIKTVAIYSEADKGSMHVQMVSQHELVQIVNEPWTSGQEYGNAVLEQVEEEKRMIEGIVSRRDVKWD
jgi:acetyl/propionyl-CoA carboxylase alpha subunit